MKGLRLLSTIAKTAVFFLVLGVAIGLYLAVPVLGTLLLGHSLSS